MIVATCPQCSARFRLTEEQTRGRSSVKMKCSRCNTVFQHALVEGPVPETFDGAAPRTLAGIPAIPGPAQPLAGGQTTIYQPGEPPSWGGVHQPDVTQSPSSGRPGSLTGFDDLFRSSSGKQVTAATDGAAAVVAPADGQPRRSALDELASMGADSAAPFMDDFLGGGSTGSRPRATSGDVQSTVALASGTVAPAPPPPVGRTMTAMPAVTAQRSPLEDLSGFTGMHAAPTTRNELPPAPVARSPFDDLSGLQHLPAPSGDGSFANGQTEAADFMLGARGQADAVSLSIREASPSVGAGAATAQKATPGAAGRRAPLPNDPLPPIGDGKGVTAGGKKTFYPMLEFGQEFGGLNDEPPASPLASAAMASSSAVAEPARPRTQALQMPSSLMDPVAGHGGSENAPGARAEREVSDDAALLALAAQRTSQRSSGDDELNQLRFDVVGDPALRNQPRVPYDQALLGSLAVFVTVALAAIGWAAARNHGVFDFRDPGYMWAIATGAVAADDRVSESALANAVVIGDGLADPRAAEASSVVRLSNVEAGRYQVPDGPLLALVEGTLTNVSSAPLRRLLVEVRLVNSEDVEQVALQVPAGTAFESAQLDAILDSGTLHAAVDAAVLRTAHFALPAGQSTRFSAVFVPSDELDLTGLTPVVRPVSAEQGGVTTCWAPLVLDAPSAAIAQGDAQAGAVEGSTASAASGAVVAGTVEGSAIPAEPSGSSGDPAEVETP